MQIFNENELLDQNFRLNVIQEIEGQENQKRKEESFKRWEVLKDRAKKYIIDMLLNEMDEETVREMEGRASNINLFKKVISKKARVYKTAPERTLQSGNENQFVMMQDLINLNSTMKKTNRYLEAFRNCLVFIRPYKCHDESRSDGEPVYKYHVKILPPHMYDVIEDEQDNEMARAYILSDFSPKTIQTEVYSQLRGRTGSKSSFRDGDDKNQVIADSPADKDQPEKHYVFWSNDYHFTCDEKGQLVGVVDESDIVNQIGELPFVDLAKDRDGSYWSVGGEDLIEGSLLTNMLLTDYNFIQKIQGMGIFYMFGKNVPKKYKVGPNRGITMQVEDGDPTPQIGFASANPNLTELREGIAAQIALLLSTNDLGMNSVSVKLDGSNFQSGIQELIQHSEPLNAIEDDQQIFLDNEQDIVRIACKWHNYFLEKKLLHSDFAQYGSMDEFDYSLSFPKPEQYQPEKQRLETYKMKKDLGIADEVLILMEDKGLTEQEAEQEILAIQKRKNKKMARVLINGDREGEGDEGIRPDEETEQDQEQDS
jgi:hypothetical protein